MKVTCIHVVGLELNETVAEAFSEHCDLPFKIQPVPDEDRFLTSLRYHETTYIEKDVEKIADLFYSFDWPLPESMSICIEGSDHNTIISHSGLTNTKRQLKENQVKHDLILLMDKINPTIRAVFGHVIPKILWDEIEGTHHISLDLGEKDGEAAQALCRIFTHSLPVKEWKGKYVNIGLTLNGLKSKAELAITLDEEMKNDAVFYINKMPDSDIKNI